MQSIDGWVQVAGETGTVSEHRASHSSYPVTPSPVQLATGHANTFINPHPYPHPPTWPPTWFVQECTLTLTLTLTQPGLFKSVLFVAFMKASAVRNSPSLQRILGLGSGRGLGGLGLGSGLGGLGLGARVGVRVREG